MAFVTPESIWATKEGHEAFRERLASALERTEGIVAEEATKMLEDAIAGRKQYDSVLWRIIALGAWMRIFKVSR